MTDREHRHHWIRRLFGPLGLRVRHVIDRARDEIYYPAAPIRDAAADEAAAAQDRITRAIELDIEGPEPDTGNGEAPEPETPWHGRANYGNWRWPGPQAETETPVPDTAPGPAAAEAAAENVPAGQPEQEPENQEPSVLAPWAVGLSPEEAAETAEALRLANNGLPMTSHQHVLAAEAARRSPDIEISGAPAADSSREHIHLAAAEADPNPSGPWGKPLTPDDGIQAAQGRTVDEVNVITEPQAAGAEPEPEAVIMRETEYGWFPVPPEDAARDRELTRRRQQEAAADAEPEMGEDYYTATPGSPEHRAAYEAYAEATGGLLLEDGYTVGEMYEVDNAAELAAERWQEEMEAEGDRQLEDEAGPSLEELEDSYRRDMAMDRVADQADVYHGVPLDVAIERELDVMADERARREQEAAVSGPAREDPTDSLLWRIDDVLAENDGPRWGWETTPRGLDPEVLDEIRQRDEEAEAEGTAPAPWQSPGAEADADELETEPF